jgi:thymidylate synthase
MWQQRSCDSFLGIPFNIASYALLTHMLAQQADLMPHELIFNGGDCHIYQNHLEQINEQLAREPRPQPTISLPANPPDNIRDYKWKDIELSGYDSHPPIDAPIAI